MYDITNLNKDGDLNKDYILSKTTEYAIYSHYLGGKFRIGDVFSSPLRDKDEHPSFGIFRANNGTLMFKDLGTGEAGDCFKFVQLLCNKRTYKSALLEVYTELILNENNRRSISLNTIPKEKEKADLGIQRGKFAKYDLDYWLQYNITEEILKEFDVSKCYKVYKKNEVIKYHNRNNPIYAYKIFNNFKIYMPLAEKGQKWLSNLTPFDIGGYKQLPAEGDLLIISKALKDVMFLYSIGIPAICPSSETAHIPSNIINKLKKRFKTIIVWYDNDEAGINAAKKINKKYNIPYKYIPIEYKEKDLTDFYVIQGLEKTKDLIKWELK